MPGPWSIPHPGGQRSAGMRLEMTDRQPDSPAGPYRRARRSLAIVSESTEAATSVIEYPALQLPCLPLRAAGLFTRN